MVLSKTTSMFALLHKDGVLALSGAGASAAGASAAGAATFFF